MPSPHTPRDDKRGNDAPSDSPISSAESIAMRMLDAIGVVTVSTPIPCSSLMRRPSLLPVAQPRPWQIPERPIVRSCGTTPSAFTSLPS